MGANDKKKPVIDVPSINDPFLHVGEAEPNIDEPNQLQRLDHAVGTNMSDLMMRQGNI